MAEDPHRRPRVLLVDDDEGFLAGFAGYLERKGFEVLTAHDGEEAIAIAIKGDVDVGIIDIMMPKLDGLSVVAALRSYSSTSKIPLVTLSGQSGEPARTAAIDAGADMAMEKPCAPEDIEAVINVFLARARRLNVAKKT